MTSSLLTLTFPSPNTDRFPSCEIPCAVWIGVSNNSKRIRELSVMNSKSSSSLQVSEYPHCRHCMHFERLDIVPVQGGYAAGDIRLTSECHIYEWSNHWEIFFTVCRFVLTVGVSQISLRIKWRLSQFCIHQSESSYDCVDVTSLTDTESSIFGILDLDS